MQMRINFNYIMHVKIEFVFQPYTGHRFLYMYTVMCIHLTCIKTASIQITF